MSDLIKRDDAIEAVCEIVPIRDDAVEIAEAIRAIPSADLNAEFSEWARHWFKDSADRPQEWISCSERLPEKQTTVLYSLEGCVSVAFMTDRNYTGETVELHWEDLETGITIYPEAWMPLPEPWKGADDE